MPNNELVPGMESRVPAREARQPGYLPHLDGVRGISILLVVLSHVGLGHLVPGGLGVTVFFFVSGYLITSLLRQERAATGMVSLRRFYLRRLWRLYPALLVYAMVAMIFAYMVKQSIDWKEPLFAIFYASNYYNLFIGYTPVHGTYSPFGIQGSLAIEEHFYLLFAPLVWFVKSNRALIRILLFMLALPLLIRIGVMQWMTPAEFASKYTYGATECRLDCIAYGCLLAMMDWPRLSKRRSFWLAVVGLGLIFSSLVIRDSYFRDTFRFSIQGIGLFLIFLPFIFSEHFNSVRHLLSMPVLVHVGKLSYSIYLYHWLVVIGLVIWQGEAALQLSWQLPFWGLSYLLAASSFYLVEQPCIAFRRRYGSHVNV